MQSHPSNVKHFSPSPLAPAATVVMETGRLDAKVFLHSTGKCSDTKGTHCRSDVISSVQNVRNTIARFIVDMLLVLFDSV